MTTMTMRTYSRTVTDRQGPPQLSSLDQLEGVDPSIRRGRKYVPAKEVIVYKGDPAGQLFVIISGKVKVSAPSEDGKEVIFGILGPGELFGEMGILDGGEHQATVTALVSTELAVLDRQDVRRCLGAFPAMALKLLTILCRRLRQTSEIAEDLSFHTLPVRLAKKLSALAEAYGEPTSKGVRICLPLCQQELANLVGTTRESINKQLAVWQADGIITTEQGCLTIRRLTGLAALAGQGGSRGDRAKAAG